MKISSRIEGSLCGAILSPRRTLWLNTNNTGGRPSRTIYGSQGRLRRRPQAHENPRNPSSNLQSDSHDYFTSWIPPPVQVNAVSQISKANHGTANFVVTQISKRWSHSGVEHAIESGAGEDKSRGLPEGFLQDKQEMLSLVDQVQSGTVDDYLNFQRDPFMRGYAAADGPELTVSDRVHDKEFPDATQVRSAGDRIRQKVAKLQRAIHHRLSNPYKTDIDHVYKLYEELPEPRILHLPANVRHRLMMVLGREEKNRASMLRYFAVVADIQRAGLCLTRAEWNSCVAFASRWVGHVSERETSAAVQMWKEMETDAATPGNAVTFNILFDVASKAGNFALAELVYQEMEKRNLKWNRYHHVSLIHFFGLKMDSDGIRAAYKEMVEAGELIDTVVLNCVISGFLRCGEEYAAERVYERMKVAHERAPKMPYRNYMDDKILTKVLFMFAKVSRHAAKRASKKEEKGNVASTDEDASQGDVKGDPSTASSSDSSAKDKHADTESNGADGALRKHFQKQSPITPDVQTYRILLNHYAIRMAALDKVALFLDDMKWLQIPLHGAIFLAIFKGFAFHGGPGQKWSHLRLLSVYKAFQAAVAENANGIYVDAWMARWILRAFHRCDTEEKVLEVWTELKPRCEKDFKEGDMEHLEDFLVELLSPAKAHRGFRDRNMFGEICPGRGRSHWHV